MRKLSFIERIAIAIGCIFLVGGIGYVDYISGIENSMLLFYLVPIALATWFVGPIWGTIISAASVSASCIADVSDVGTTITPWNVGTSFCAYLLFTFLIWRWHLLLIEMDSRVKERTQALQEELTRRQEAEREIARIGEQERTRIGRELHDSLGQHLTGTALLAQTVATHLPPQEATQGTARKVVQLINEGIELTRKIARGLYSSELDGEGLFFAMDSLARAISQEGVDCQFTHHGSPPKSKELATQLYWIAREATNNAIKHAQPEHVEIQLNTTGDHCILTVMNDGERSFDVVNHNGIGLKVMAQRAELAGGVLRVQRLDSGTIVKCEVPITQHE